MNTAAEHWVEAYARWSPAHQVGFSAVLLLAAILLVVLAGCCLIRLAHLMVACLRGWPEDATRPAWKDMVELSRAMERYRAWEKSHPLPPKVVGKPEIDA